MTNYELLNSQQHSDLKLRPRLELDPHFVRISTLEFSAAATSCPIMLTKDPENGEFIVGVVLSLKPGEAPLKNAEERGGFIPMSLQCDGFYVSDENIAIDTSNTRFDKVEGESLFTESLQPNNCLRDIQLMLGKLNTGIGMTKDFLDKISELKVIEPIDMNLAFENSEKLTLQGLYTVSLDRLHELNDETLLKLIRSGYLELIYIMANSLKQFSVLAQLRNKRVKAN